MQGTPRESSEQSALVKRIRRAGWLVVHTPNQGRRSAAEVAALKRMGFVSGFPDLFVFGAPAGSAFPGVGIELRRQGRTRTVTAERERVYQQLEAAGFLVLREQEGEQAAFALTRLGYLPASELPGWQEA